MKRLLASWYRRGHRDLPWRHTQDPYRIWVSEIMLQQTRAQAVIPYYQRFLDRFRHGGSSGCRDGGRSPGAVGRAGILFARAQSSPRRAAGGGGRADFRENISAIRALPGIGDYTAAAIASIAFHLPHAVVDGNVLRVVARMENDAADIASPRTRERFRAIAREWMGRGHPGVFNQALMELGATVCLPANPLCHACPLSRDCRALAAGTVAQLPVKLRKIEPVAIAAELLLVRRGQRVLLRQKEATARRMAGFWELPSPEELPGSRVGSDLGTFRHTITHHHYTFTVRSASARSAGPPFRWFRAEELLHVPLSTTARKALTLSGFVC